MDTNTQSCVYGSCTQPRGRALGLCNAHYIRQSRGKPMDRPVRVYGATDAERFWSKVRKSSGCWEWTAATVAGYGVFRMDSRNHQAHRVSFAWQNGSIPEGSEVDHTCFNRSCVNPAHLRLLAHAENGQNRASANSNSKSGVRGVYWAQSQWIAKAQVGSDVIEVGRFSDLDEAERAISEWRRQNMPASIRDQERAA